MRLLIFAVIAVFFISQPGKSATNDWPAYGHDTAATRYSPLAQINCKNVSRLKVAWMFHTGDISKGTEHRRRSGFETTPILVDGTLYLTTGFNRVIALEPVTGTQRWAFDPKNLLKNRIAQ